MIDVSDRPFDCSILPSRKLLELESVITVDRQYNISPYQIRVVEQLTSGHTIQTSSAVATNPRYSRVNEEQLQIRYPALHIQAHYSEEVSRGKSPPTLPE